MPGNLNLIRATLHHNNISSTTVDYSLATEDRTDYRLLPFEVWLAWPVFVTITTVGLAGNLLVMAAIVGSRLMMRSAMNRLLLNLAVADFSNLLSNTFHWVQILLNHGTHWSLPGWTCPCITYATIAFLYSSLLFQVAVSVERYMAISRPLHVRLIWTRAKVRVCAVAIWSFSIVFAVPYLLHFTIYSPAYHTGFHICIPKPSLPMPFKIAECLVFYLGPLMLLLLIYGKIARLLWANPGYLGETIRHSGRSIALARIRGRRRVVKMLVCCVGIYFICYSPMQALYLSSLLFRSDPPIRRFSIYMIMNAFIYASSACNPILYSLFSSRFRFRFLQLLCRVQPIARLFGVTSDSRARFPELRRQQLALPVEVAASVLRRHDENAHASMSPVVGACLPIDSSVDMRVQENGGGILAPRRSGDDAVASCSAARVRLPMIHFYDDDDVPITVQRSEVGLTRGLSAPHMGNLLKPPTHTPLTVLYSADSGVKTVQSRVLTEGTLSRWQRMDDIVGQMGGNRWFRWLPRRRTEDANQ